MYNNEYGVFVTPDPAKENQRLKKINLRLTFTPTPAIRHERPKMD